jgi:hypothetical protein
MTNLNKFDIALSFAGEDRVYVEEVANLLTSQGVKVFYDKFEEASLLGKNLYDYLSEVYSDKALYTVMFISKHYKEKVWTNLERQAMQSKALREKGEYVLPVRFDDTEIPGLLPTVSYISLIEKSPNDLVEIICKKLSLKLND